MNAFLLHGVTLALAWFLVFNAAMTAAVALLAARLAQRERSGSPALWLALRLAPAVLSIAFVAVVFLPSYWQFEPREGVEGFDLTLTTLAALALAVVGSAVVRGVIAWRGAARRTADWMRASRPLALAGTSMPAFAVDTDAPVMALVGVLRPRLLITQAGARRPHRRGAAARASRTSSATGGRGTTSSVSRCGPRPTSGSPPAPRARSSGAGPRHPSMRRIAAWVTASVNGAPWRRRWSKLRE